jgi:hypothetical protein
VTGVQTCALPISKAAASANCSFLVLFYCSFLDVVLLFVLISFTLFDSLKWLTCFL